MITVYTDGSFRASENKGGYGVVFFNENNELIYAYQEQIDNTTNNKMELMAILHTIEIADRCFPDEDMLIYSDSAYCVNSINTWAANWSKNGWINSKKEPVKNQDLIKIIYNYFTKKNCKSQLFHLKGHANNIGNELADALATANKAKIFKILEDNHIVIKKFDF